MAEKEILRITLNGAEANSEAEVSIVYGKLWVGITRHWADDGCSLEVTPEQAEALAGALRVGADLYRLMGEAKGPAPGL